MKETLSFDLQLDYGSFRLEGSAELGSRITGVFGASGAGKSSLLRAIAGVESCARGHVRFGDECLLDTQRGVFVPPEKRHFGLVFQEQLLFPHKTVLGNLRYGLDLLPETKRRISLEDVTGKLGLASLLAKRPHALSGGERQRVALARSVLACPRLLLLDEPLTGLEASLREETLDWLGRLSAEHGIRMLMVSHSLTDLLELTDSLLVLQGGRILGHGPYHELLKDRQSRLSMHDLGMESLLKLRVVGIDESAHATRLRLGTCEMLVPGLHGPVGEVLRVAIRPTDVALATHPLEGTSIQNQLEMRVDAVVASEDFVIVELLTDDDQQLSAEISHAALHKLNVETGRRLVCLIKAQAIRVLGKA